MPYKQKQRRYHIKPLPCLILIFIVVLVISFIIFFKINKKPLQDSLSPQMTAEGESNMSSIETSSVSSSPSSSSVSSSSSSKKTPSASALSQNNAVSDKSSSNDEKPISAEGLQPDLSELPSGNLSDWNLILLNPEEENKIDEELNFEKTKFDSQYVDSRTADAYSEMKNAAADDNITLYLRSGYRSIQTQKNNYNNAVAVYKSQGKSEEEAVCCTNEYYTVPGHSEHHSGLAFDIITPEYHRDVYQLDERFMNTKAFEWLKTHCTDYGFILRYTKDKKNITKINFESWHYRYVGVEHAKYMQKYNLCLEEYIELLKKAGR